MIKISPARVAAFEILSKIESENSFSSILLPQYEEGLGERDRGLCHQITLGVLRRKLYLDKIIESLTKKDLSKFDPEVVSALRIGIFQMLFLERIPAYSAINDSVNLVYRAKKRSASGLVNAVLRRVSRGEIPELNFENDFERISFETSHPEWLIKKWSDQFGSANAEAIAAANNVVSKPAFRLTKGFSLKPKEMREEIFRILENSGVTRSENREDCFFAESFDENLRRLVETGDIYFQEEGSQMVGEAVKLEKDDKFLDLCASPGSKTTLIYSRLGEEFSGLVAAGDLHWRRIKILQENCIRQFCNKVEIVNYDAEKAIPFAENSFNAVLLDAPCSGTGTIRQNPEIRYSVRADDFRDLPAKQLNLLENASKIVKEGGKLIYSTCSLEMQENEGVIESFLANNSNFEKIAPHVPNRFLTEDGFSRTFPHRDKMDGFFIAEFKKLAVSAKLF